MYIHTYKYVYVYIYTCVYMCIALFGMYFDVLFISSCVHLSNVIEYNDLYDTAPCEGSTNKKEQILSDPFRHAFLTLAGGPEKV